MVLKYQRGNVWSLEDKQLLIDSIFNNRDIGKFVFCRLKYEPNSKGYEVLDGKQRITAIIEFIEDRFEYKGFVFSELSWADQNQFDMVTIAIATIDEPTEKEKYEYFLKLNVAGHAVDPKHIEYVESLLKNEK